MDYQQAIICQAAKDAQKTPSELLEWYKSVHEGLTQKATTFEDFYQFAILLRLEVLHKELKLRKQEKEQVKAQFLDTSQYELLMSEKQKEIDQVLNLHKSPVSQ